jgi:hypothetical protein
VLAGVATLAIVGAGVYWAKGKAEGLLEGEKKIDELKQKANANAFDAPADGLIAEPRLLTFLEVRKRVYAVYEKNQAAIESMRDKKEADFGDVKAAFSFLNDLRIAQAQAQADLAMSEAEYRFLVENVYKSAWAAAVVGDSGKNVSEVATEGLKQAEDAIAQALKEAEKQGVPGAAEATREEMEKARREVGEAMSEVKAIEVPPANIALFKKHEAEIKKYAMGGLELMGL